MAKKRHTAEQIISKLRDTEAALRRPKVQPDAPFTLTCFRQSLAQNHANAGTPPKTRLGYLGTATPGSPWRCTIACRMQANSRRPRRWIRF